MSVCAVVKQCSGSSTIGSSTNSKSEAGHALYLSFRHFLYEFVAPH